MKVLIQSCLQTLALALAVTIPTNALQAGTVVIGASGVGSIDGLYLGNTNLGPGNDNFYGFGALSSPSHTENPSPQSTLPTPSTKTIAHEH